MGIEINGVPVGMAHVSILDPIVTQELGDSPVRVMSQGAIQQHVMEPITRNSKRITNLEALLDDSVYITDAGTASRKAVPLNAAPYAAITQIGGMTYRDEKTGTFKHANVKALRSRNINLANQRGWSATNINYDTTALAKTNPYGTTISATSGDTITVTQSKYPDTETLSNFTNGYVGYVLNEHLVVGERYRISFDIKINNNPLSASKIGIKPNDISPINISFANTSDKQRVSTIFVYSKHPTYTEAHFIEFMCSGMSFDIGNVMITRADITDTTYVPYGVIDTLAIPEKVQTECAGYEFGISENYRNYFEFTNDGRVLYHEKAFEFIYKSSYALSKAAISGQTTTRFYIKQASGNLANRLYSDLYSEAKISICDKLPFTNYNTDAEGFYPDQYAPAIAVKSPYATAAETQEWLDGARFILALAEPIVTDVTHLFTPDSFLKVQGGGDIVPEDADGNACGAYTSITYQKEA